jgi:two-component system, NtrC family, response regulator HydG
MMSRLLLVDDDPLFRRSTAELLAGEGYEVRTASDGAAALKEIRNSRFDLLLLDLRMPGVDGMAIVEALRVWGDGIPIVMLSGYGTVDAAVRALHLGADDFLTKPVEPDLLSARIAALLERRPSGDAADRNPGGMVGRAPAMLDVYDAIRRVAPSDATVLVTGETGTGKELVARAVHELSPRATGAFLPINCGALGDGVLESELFGHVRGAFTGALRDKAGLFEAASGGTIFLDEIGEMGLGAQQRLLRVLQEREVLRVGATRPTRVDVRVVAASNRDLRAAVTEGCVREDLFYRLHVFPIHLPPLRERRTDIPLLITRALEQVRQRVPAGTPPACSPLAMRLLRVYDWPGNVRELFSVVESAAIRAGGPRIEAQHLPAEVRAAAEDRYASERYHAATGDDERAAIEAALASTGGALTKAAALLGMGRTTLWRKMKLYGIASRVDETG